MTTDEEYRRIRWASRRGMLELDVLLLPFVEEQLNELTEAERTLYGELLKRDDPELVEWFYRGAMPDDPAMAALVQRIRERRCNR